ncbi:FAD-dependent oxidoreductase [Pseudoduganella sp. SL102]|uniref:hydroxysqualene dehydroxylase n=1 Tax=Pseudoduganella sp. SL102 TaxID=2995154 RepID=UPI00248A9211|nr:FAD-dependent oxidoreductase [Pseudoduganella sp. SL102]WBS05281.1 FAD-dependent oxidoreductase [Pseudoduganella sp. SL102]
MIIGGGLAGLACGVALADHGLRCHVFEAAGRLGGRASSWQDETTGDTVDIGPHIVHSEYHNMLAFLRRLGTEHLVTWQPGKVLALSSKPRPVHLRHAPLPPPLSLVPSALPAPGLTMLDNLSMARVGWSGMLFHEADVARLDGISAEHYLRDKGVSERMIDWWWRFAAMVVTNVPLERCSAASLMRIHALLSNARGLHFGFGAVGLAELYAEQATRIITAAGGSVSVGAPVAGFTGGERVDGIVLADGTRLAGDVVSALPPTALKDIVPPAWRTLAPFGQLPAFEPSPYICVYLWFDRAFGVERFWSHLYSPQRLNYDFYDLRQIRAGWQGRPTVICSNIIHSHRAHHLGDDEIVQATLRELAEGAPAAAQARLVHARVHRVPMAIPCPVTGFEAARPATGSPVPGLVLAGDWVRTHLPCTMESAVKSGFMAAERVLAGRGVQARLAIPVRPFDGLTWLLRKLARVPASPDPAARP